MSYCVFWLSQEATGNLEMSCRTDWTLASIPGMETNWLRPLSPRVILISLITSSSSAICRWILTSRIIILSKTTPSVMEMLGGTWQIWIGHLYFPLTFRCRQGLIGFWERSLFLWIRSSHKRCSGPFVKLLVWTNTLVFCCTFLAVPAVCSKRHIYCLYLMLLSQNLVLSCLRGRLSWKWGAFSHRWSRSSAGPIHTSLLLHFSSPLLLGKGLLMVSWAQIWTNPHLFNSQLSPRLSLALLLDICRKCCSSRAWGYDLGWWNAESNVPNRTFVLVLAGKEV